MKSSESASKGGGAIYRIIAPDALTPDFDLTKALSDSVVLFAPLMRLLTPSAPEQVRLSDIEFIREAAEKITPFDPTDLDDGRRKVLRQIAVRQGQSKFREKLLDAYDFRCAITGTAIPATLQAAHILPYKGPETNSVQNGLLLRADIHNLFDLGLIEIDPDTLVISIADELRATAFRKLDGRTLRRPKSHHHMPSREALQLRRHLFHLAASGTDLERTPSSPQQIEGERVSGLGALVGTRN